MGAMVEKWRVSHQKGKKVRQKKETGNRRGAAVHRLLSRGERAVPIYTTKEKGRDRAQEHAEDT